MKDVSAGAMEWGVTQANTGWDIQYEKADGASGEIVYEAANDAVPPYYDARWELYVGLRAYMGSSIDEWSNIDIDMNERCGVILSNIAESLIYLGARLYKSQG